MFDRHREWVLPVAWLIRTPEATLAGAKSPEQADNAALCPGTGKSKREREERCHEFVIWLRGGDDKRRSAGADMR